MSNKSGAERSIEALTWASVVIWLGFALVMDLLGYVGLVVMMLGIILLSSAIYQRSRGWHTSLTIWVFGIWMAVFSVLETVSNIVEAINPDAGLRIDLWVYLGIALISMGVAVVLRSVHPPGTSSRSQVRRASQEAARYEGDGRPHIPRRVATSDLSTGYFPSPDEAAPSGAASYSAAARATATGSEWETANVGAGYGYEEPATLPTDAIIYETPAEPLPGASAPRDQSAPRGYETRPLQPPAAQSYETRPLNDPGYYYDQPRSGAPRDEILDAGADDRLAMRRMPRRRARSGDEPADLQARVEDIIRRSRERRNAPPDEPLPY